MKIIQNPLKMIYGESSFTPFKLDANSSIIHLERNLKDIQQMRNELSSYRCEPHTYSMYRRKEALKKGLDALKRSDQEIISVLRDGRKAIKEFDTIIKKQYSEFNNLQKGIDEYVLSCRTHQHV